jgi:hypothetical protein
MFTLHIGRRMAIRFWTVIAGVHEVIRARRRLAIEGLVAIAGLVIVAASGIHPPSGLIGAAVALIAAVAWVWDYRQLAAGFVFEGASRRTGEEYAPPFDGWEKSSVGGREAIYCPDFNRRLRDESEKIDFTLHEEMWLPVEDASARDLRIRTLAGLRLNEGKIRMCSDPPYTQQTPVKLQPTDYASFLVTNRLAYEEISSRSTRATELSFNDFDDEGRIRSLRQSHSSNHIGGDLLAIAPDSFLLQLQDRSNGIYPGHYAGSSSGSFDFPKDLIGATDLRDIVKNGLIRELSEEAGITGEGLPTHEDCRVIGFARASYFGGKPQFFGVARVPYLRPKIVSGEYVESQKIISFTPDDSGLSIVEKLLYFLSRHDRVSPSLVMLTAFMKLWIEEDAGAGQWLGLYRP